MEDYSNEYQNSKLVDYNRWSTHKNVDNLVNSLKGIIGSRKYRDYLVNMKVVIMNLYYAYLVDPIMHTSYFGNKNRYKFIDKYNPNKLITASYFTGVIEVLAANGYVAKKRGGHFYDEINHEYYGYTNKMKATQKLIDLFEEYKLTPEMIEKFDYTSSLIIMKDLPYYRYYINRKGIKVKTKIKDECDYPVNRYTDALKKTVYEYNRLLDMTYIDIDTECISDKDRKTLTDKANSRKFRRRHNNTRLDLAQKNVYRVFNNNSFKNGGRFYSAWWMGCPGELRKYIYINGKPTTELDFSGMHIHLLYALRGVNYAEPYQDPYSLIEKDPERDLNKLILLTAINADKESAAVNSTYRQLLDNNELVKYNLTEQPKIKIGNKLKSLKEKHSLIADDIASGKGIELQYYDSSIINKLIKYYTKQNVAILTVHDSVICQKRYANFVKDKMWQYYYDILTTEINLNVDYKSINPQREVIFSNQNSIAKRPNIDTLFEYNSLSGIKNYNAVKVKYGDLVISIKNKANYTRCSNCCSYYRRYKSYMNNRSVLHYTSINIRDVLSSTISTIL